MYEDWFAPFKIKTYIRATRVSCFSASLTMALCGRFQTMVGGKLPAAESLFSRQTIYKPHLQNNIEHFWCYTESTFWHWNQLKNIKDVLLFFYFTRANVCLSFLLFLPFALFCTKSESLCCCYICWHLFFRTMTQNDVIHHSEQRVNVCMWPPDFLSLSWLVDRQKYSPPGRSNEHVTWQTALPADWDNFHLKLNVFFFGVWLCRLVITSNKQR